MKNLTQRIAEKDFSAKTLKALGRKGITVINATAAPAFEGDRYFTGVVYHLDDNGTGRVRDFRAVLALAE